MGYISARDLSISQHLTEDLQIENTEESEAFISKGRQL